ncbi:MAG: septum formation initiator family protein [Ferruginibacter sp.]
MKLLTHIPSWLKNKFLLISAFFVVWMVFFDQKDILSLFDRRDKLSELEKSQQHLKKLIIETSKQQDLLINNIQGTEKYARETFMMKKDNEDLFIVKAAPENK